MKKIYFVISLIAATFCLSPLTASAQAQDPKPKDTGVALNKYVTGPDEDGQYLITLEAYAKGESVTTVTEEVQPNDIILVMDYSSSMTSNSINVNVKTKVASGTTLTAGTNYIVTIGGVDYYLKGFTAQGPSGNYTALDRQGYSYNGYGNNTYYYKDGDEYYQVKRGSQNSRYYLSYSKDRTYYLSGNEVTTDRPTNIRKPNDTIWTGVLYTPQMQTNYYYRYGTTNPNSITAGQEFYTGTSNYIVTDSDKIYTYSTQSKTRLAIAKEAASQFVKTVYENSPENPEGTTEENKKYHKLAVVRFNTAAGTLVNLQNVTGSSYTTIQNAINDYNTVANGTRPWLGLSQAGTILETVKNDGRKKIVVFFTDGVPGDSPSTLDASYARQSVHSAYALKTTYDATVFSVAVLSANDMSKMNMRRFLHYVSSNYKFDIDGGTYNFGSDNDSAVCQIEGHTDWHGSEDPHDYYQLSDGSDLTSIFDAIAKEASEGGSTKQLGSETTTVLDVLTAEFVLPEGTDESNIGLFVDSVTGHSFTDGNDVYTFGNRVNLVPAGADRNKYVSIENATTSDGKTTKKIVVTGFDFTKDDKKDGNAIVWTEDGEVEVPGNWVGPRILGIGSTPKYYGRRLVITIPIEPAPDYQGGYSLPTNTAESGLYSKGSDTPVDVFPVPNLDFPSIGLIKYGLKKGESATFSVQRIKDSRDTDVTDAAYTIILTGTSTDGSAPAYTIIKNIPEGTYRVAESNWSWTYNVTAVSVKDGENVTNLNPSEAKATTQVLAKNQTSDWPSGISETVKCVLFKFTNAKKDGDDGSTYAESVAKNKFIGGSVKEPGTQTVQSKGTE